MGVGKSGETLERAEKVIQEITDQKISSRKSKSTIRDFGIHKGEPIGLIATIRGDAALETLKRLLESREMKLSQSSFDKLGNCSFGIKEHIEIPGVKYDPGIGIFGMDVSLVFERPGYRVSRRQRAKGKIGLDHRVNKEVTLAYLRSVVGAEVV